MPLCRVALFAVLSLQIASTVAAEPTFNRDIAPLVFAKCAGCHHPGKVAPFSLLSYDDVAKRAELIEEIVIRRAMPPWKPVGTPGLFANERRLTDDEIDLIRRWVAAGAPEGNAADLPAAPTFADGWRIGEPDLVLQVAEPIAVPADGRDLYVNVVLPLEVPAGKYLKAIEFRPGNARVVHHAVMFIDTSGKARERDDATPEQGFRAVTPPGKFLPGALGVWTPGRNPMPLSDGLSMAWPADGDFVLNLHLHPSGKPETEQSTIGVYFTHEPSRRPLFDFLLIDKNIDIAPGESAFRTHDAKKLPTDVDVLTIFPHMHMLGRAMTITAKLPDGTTRTLLDINDWDFNWQDLYEYAEPLRLPAGTELVLDAVHDNSADNPQNPRHPPERVRWGEQTFNEMSLAFLCIVPAVENAPQGADRQLTALIRAADSDGDAKLSVAEIVAALKGKRTEAEIRKLVDAFDRDGDKLLDVEESLTAVKVLSKK